MAGMVNFKLFRFLANSPSLKEPITTTNSSKLQEYWEQNNFTFI